MRQSPPPSTHDSRSGPSSISRRKPTRHTIRGFFPKHLPTGSPTPTSNPTTTGYTMPSQPHAVSPTLPRRRSTAPIPLPSPPISHGGAGRWNRHIPTRFSLSMRTGPRVSLHSFWSRCRRAKARLPQLVLTIVRGGFPPDSPPPRTKRNQSTIHQKPKYQEKQYGIVHRHPRHPDPSARQSQS